MTLSYWPSGLFDSYQSRGDFSSGWSAETKSDKRKMKNVRNIENKKEAKEEGDGKA